MSYVYFVKSNKTKYKSQWKSKKINLFTFIFRFNLLLKTDNDIYQIFIGMKLILTRIQIEAY